MKARLARRVVQCLGTAACASGALGCSLLGRLSVLPNVDSHGGTGIEAKLTLGVGLTTEFDHEKSEEPRIGVVSIPFSASEGVRLRDNGRAELGFDTGLEYASIGRHAAGFGFRAGAGVTSRSEERRALQVGATVSGAALWTLTSRRTPGSWDGSRLALGPAVEATALGGDDERGVGRVGVGLALDFYDLTQWTVR